MKRFGILILLVASLTVLVAGSAAAEKLAYEGFFKLQFVNLGGASASDTGTGVATVNGSAGGGHLTTLKIDDKVGQLNAFIPVTDPVVTVGGIVAVQMTDIAIAPEVQGGVFRPISGAVQSTTNLTQNTMAITGQAKICLYLVSCEVPLTVELTQTRNGPLQAAGVGGVLTVGGPGGIRISILGAPWTVKTISISNRVEGGNITTFRRFGFAHGPASATSSTALTSGVIQLVSANQTITQGIPGNSDKQGQYEELRLHFIPEPGLLLLLGSGAIGLGLLGRKRLRK